MRYLLIFLLSLLYQSAYAEIYTYIDHEGNRVFTDQPRRGNAQRVEPAPPNSAAPIRPRPLYAPAESNAPPAPPAYQLLRIIIPEPDASIRANDGNLIVSVSSDPILQPNHLYRLLLDGQAVGKPGRSPVFPLVNVDRGTHQLSVEIVDAWGRTVEQTPNQPFHMFRVSVAEAPEDAKQPKASMLVGK